MIQRNSISASQEENEAYSPSCLTVVYLSLFLIISTHLGTIRSPGPLRILSKIHDLNRRTYIMVGLRQPFYVLHKLQAWNSNPNEEHGVTGTQVKPTPIPIQVLTRREKPVPELTDPILNQNQFVLWISRGNERSHWMDRAAWINDGGDYFRDHRQGIMHNKTTHILFLQNKFYIWVGFEWAILQVSSSHLFNVEVLFYSVVWINWSTFIKES